MLAIRSVINMAFNKFLFVALIAILLVAGCTNVKGKNGLGAELPKFSSCNELASAFKSAGAYGHGVEEISSTGSIRSAIGSPMPLAVPTVSKSDTVAPSYSKTNVQVQGVDEADIVKTD